MQPPLAFTDNGQGRPLLLVHGFPLDGRIWNAQVARLSRSRRVIVPDLPGFGRSAAVEGPLDMDRLARMLLEFVDSLGLERFSAAGHSMGGYVLFALHRIAPERLLGLGLVTTRASPDPPEARSQRAETAARVLREGVGFLAETFPPRMLAREDLRAYVADIIRGQDPRAVAAALLGMAERPDSRGELGSIRCPTVVVLGLRDAIVPPREAREMAAAVPNSRTVELDCGHLPCMEDPHRLSEALAEI